MNVLKSVETTIANLLEGAFGRIFRSEVRPVELARKLAREMDEHRTESLSRVYAPNEFAVWLSPDDRARYEGVEHEVIDELCAYLLEHARREGLILSSPPHITFHTDERLALGEFGIQAQLVRHQAPREPVAARRGPAAAPVPASPAPPSPPAAASAAASASAGETMIYSTSARVRGPVEEAQARRPVQRAMLAVGARRLLLPAAGGTVGRSRDCDIVLDDAGISRRHAEIRPGADGWTIADLGSTNGVLLNGKTVRGRHPLRPGDRLELGSTEITFEIR
jgi:hypothetical protein